MTTRASNSITQEVSLLLEAKSYRDMAALPQEWRRSLSGQQQRELIAQLIPRLGSRRSLPLVPEADVLILPKAATRDVQEVARKTLVYRDITVEGNRCAWAIEELLLYTMPEPSRILAVGTPGQAADNPALVEGIWQDVAQAVARGMPPAPAGWPDDLPVHERRRLAESPRIDPRVLRELASDPAPEVRAAVAGNGHTDFNTLFRLCGDADAKVGAAARANTERARSRQGGEPATDSGR